MTTNPTAIGRRAELATAKWFERQGWQLLAQNWRTPWCEIDLVLKRGSELLFVEVKYRRNADFGGGVAAITRDKQTRLIRAAHSWLQQVGMPEHDWQIDVVVIERVNGRHRLRHYPNAVQSG